MADALYIAELIARQLRGEASGSDLLELATWRDASSANKSFLKEKVQEDRLIEALKDGYKVDKDATWRKFEKLKEGSVQYNTPVPVIRRYRPLSAAAIIIALVGIGLYLWYSSKQEEVTAFARPVLSSTTVTPDGGRLVLADGTLIGIDPAKQGLVTTQGIVKTSIDDHGQLVYQTDPGLYADVTHLLFDEPSVSVPELAYNELKVPYGSKYDLVLGGIHVTVNAGSTLRFPVTFTGQDRAVELIGQAFFDVHADPQHPFIVRTGKRTIEALGTEFAVRSFPDEPSQTVVLKTGRVKVRSGKTNAELTPGQMARVNKDEDITVLDVNLQNALSWKDGYFNFDDLDLRAAVCQLAQWHGMKVRIEKGVRAKSLGVGNISHGIPLPELLKNLELPDLHFEIHDDTVIVKR